MHQRLRFRCTFEKAFVVKCRRNNCFENSEISARRLGNQLFKRILIIVAKIWNAHSSAESIHDCDILLIPQATLGAKLKGKQVQYHGNCEKQKGNILWVRLSSYLFI